MHFGYIVVLVMVTGLSSVTGHGYICDPPGRSSMWRKECGGFATPTNVNDMGLNCGGLEVKKTQKTQRFQIFWQTLFEERKETFTVNYC